MGGEKKQFMLLGKRPLWKWSADNANDLHDAGICEIVLILPESQRSEDVNISWPVDNIPLRVTHGGSERAQSVLNGLKEACCDYVMIHDAARPFASKNLFVNLMENTGEDVGCIPVLPVSDALKMLNGSLISCVNRDGLYVTQTPQSFPREKLIEVLCEDLTVKDEAEAWLKSGYALNHVNGERLNFKVTWKDDMLIAKSLVSNKILRTGTGWDIHKLVPERKLILGGIHIDDTPLGLLGHSDADVLTHAIMDAILGAAGLPDIGNIFPASDDNFRGADSIKLLKEVMRLVESEGWRVEFVDAVVCAQVPRLNQYRDEIIAGLGKYFAFNVKFKSAEKIDDAGEGLSMTCQAVATLTKGAVLQ